MSDEENAELAKAVRFALVALVVGLSYANVNLSLRLSTVEQICKDMLNGRPLPMLTAWVLHARVPLACTAASIPLFAIATLFVECAARSLYVIGGLILVTFVQFFFTWHVMTLPLIDIVKSMGGTTP